MKNIIRLSLAVLAFGALLSAAPLAPTITIVPGAQNIVANTAYGFGYELTNNDPLLWLVPVGVQPLADIPGLLTWGPDVFDYPILAPGASTGSIPWILNTQGLVQFQTDAVLSFSAPYVGLITVDFEFYDGDPFSTGMLVDFASSSASFELNPGAPGTVPEPSTWLTLAAGLGFLALRRRRA